MLHERNWCLMYDMYADESDPSAILREEDLDMMAELGSLMTSRPVGSHLPHQKALQRCIKHAKLWLSKSEQQIVPNSDISYAKLREKFSRMMGLDYLINDPDADVGAYFAYKSAVLQGLAPACELTLGGDITDDKSSETNEDQSGPTKTCEYQAPLYEEEIDENELVWVPYWKGGRFSVRMEPRGPKDPSCQIIPALLFFQQVGRCGITCDY
ncbi:hypothetical protein L2E82_08407 [Cichorium intybus]|uniref:Uncharacterized protein n=1 Tax=Cichorium intybus TaxID=13427 RepID=A0ACB9G7G4_CICIN|nr:hypothetical protein L2E82_08407 [Cichorium intybus]